MTTRRKERKVQNVANIAYSKWLSGNISYREKILSLPYGQERRKKLLEWFESNKLPVNRRHCVQLYQDPQVFVHVVRLLLCLLFV